MSSIVSSLHQHPPHLLERYGHAFLEKGLPVMVRKNNLSRNKGQDRGKKEKDCLLSPPLLEDQ